MVLVLKQEIEYLLINDNFFSMIFSYNIMFAYEKSEGQHVQGLIKHSPNLSRMGSITIDTITGHYLATFEGKVYK